MAKMFPAQFDESSPSVAEKRIFISLRDDPRTARWVVLHSLGLTHRGEKPFGEVDFVVLIPGGGVICLEIKGGRIACRDGVWETMNRDGRTATLKRSPFMQAREGMFAVREAVLARIPPGFPADLPFACAVVMPDITFSVESPEWEVWEAIDREDLRNPISSVLHRVITEQRRKFNTHPDNHEPTTSTVNRLRQILRPDFETIMTRGAQIEETEWRLLRFTEEQFNTLDNLEANERCLFEGAAGTGKTMLALEYSRRSARAGLRTLFVCYNRLLGNWLERETATEGGRTQLVAGPFFRLLRREIETSSYCTEFQTAAKGMNESKVYNDLYPFYGRLAIEQRAKPFDVLVMDEAQDLLRPGVLDVLGSWLKGGFSNGHWAVFGDFLRQAIFDPMTGDQMKALLQAEAPYFARGLLRQNCRNTRSIGDETARLSGFPRPPYWPGIEDGLPVDRREYSSADEQRMAVADVLRELLRDGTRPADIVVLSHRRLEHSGIVGIDGGTEFRLVDVSETVPSRSRVPIIRFASIQAFKGMESPVVVLCDVEAVGDAEPQSLLYVGMSRARSFLIVLLSRAALPAYRECLKRGFLTELQTKS